MRPGMERGGWRFWIDRGGTFTDLVARDPAGELQVRKLLSVQPGQSGDPAVRAIRELLGLDPAEACPIPPGLIAEVRLGTTVATNAVLERAGRPTLLLLNRGFADLLTIGDQHRPQLFALEIQRPEALAQRVLEVGGRLAADGSEIEPLQCDQALADRLRQARADGLCSVAVALLHAYRFPQHELELGTWLQTFGFEAIALSHQVSPLPRLVPRAHTTVLEASVGPVLRAYLAQVQTALGPAVPLRVMQSSGGLIEPERLRAKDTILSGPAGGLVGASRIGASLGLGPLVGFDMGGTSTDVSWSEATPTGALPRREQSELAGLPLQAPMLEIHTVAAGGGSLIRFDGLRLQVGPASAGADPGPACYGRGGPLTITDANLLLGRLQPQCLPAVFGPAGDQPLDPAPLRAMFAALAEELKGASATGALLTPEQVAEGALAIAVERMAEAIRRISIQQGRDPRAAVLCSFGGAGGQHACAVAEALGISRVLLHPLAGVLSAYGIGLADEVRLLERSVRRPLSAALLAELEAALPSPARGEQRRCTLLLRSAGTETCLPIAWPLESAAQACSTAALNAAFAAAHHQRFGYAPSSTSAPVLERLSIELIQRGQPLPASIPVVPRGRTAAAAAAERVQLHLGGEWRQVPLWRREQLVPGMGLQGPALIQDATGTNLLLPHWSADALADGCLLLERRGADAAVRQGDAEQQCEGPLDPLTLELFSHRLTAIAEQMGTRLQQTSSSVNIKERLDFSCALFDARGALVVNAPHIPVHLGSMGASVAALLAAVARAERPPLAPGDVVVTNNPYNGGTHLPDLTVITPLFADGVPVAFVASRGHHADVGGITPGSMPPHSTRIEQEGLLLDNELLLRQGCFEASWWRERLGAGAWPVRNPDQLLDDLRAQLAANQLGLERLQALIAADGLARVQAAMEQVQQQAAEAVRRVIDRLASGRAVVELDGGERIAVAVQVDHGARRARLDFTGTSAQHAGNLNAPLAITQAVVLYVFRCLVEEPIPLNAGCFAPLELVVPAGSLLHPQPPAAVVAGNVETSQAVANALFAALGVMAAAQGTMNNLSFGNARCQYYETICGGTGAGRHADGRGFAGADAVQSHMTNSRLTDPELLEERLPVRLESFALRLGSGGAGRWRGGDGVVRELRALDGLTVSLLTGSRRVAPFGLAGGGDGACGVNTLIRADGVEERLPGSIALELAAGDRLRIATPGGGGYAALALAMAALLPLIGAAKAAVPVALPNGANVLQERSQRFQPLESSGGMVAAQEARAAAAGAQLLREGGNAVDAAVATAFALAVTLPQAGNLGGGGFLVLWLPRTGPLQSCAAARRLPALPQAVPIGRGEAVALDFRETAPLAARPDLFLDADGRVNRERATRSLLSTGVPGSVAGLVQVQRRYGCLPLARVMAPAIGMAERGFPVGAELAASLRAAAPLLAADPTSRRLFLRPYRAGELLRQPELAGSLRCIARQGDACFYRGRLAQALTQLMERGGGLIRAADLRAYRARWRRPLAGVFRGHPVLTMPPPSGGGATLLQLLNVLEPLNLGGMGLNSAAALHPMVEALNLAYRDRNRLLGDPDQLPMPLERLISRPYADGQRRQILADRHRPAAALEAQRSSAEGGTNTTHLSVVDRDGGLVALTTTLNTAYGNGISVPGAGFLLNNEMDDFTSALGAANAYGLRQGAQNAIAPGRRPLSSMTPTLVFLPDGRPLLATGSPGGSRIISTVLQVLLNRLAHGLNLASAVAATRVHSQLWPDQISHEEGLSADTIQLLQAKGHQLVLAPAMGSANSVEVRYASSGAQLPSGSFGVADPRRLDAAAVAERP